MTLVMEISKDGIPPVFGNSINLPFTCFSPSQALIIATKSSSISSDSFIVFRCFLAFSSSPHLISLIGVLLRTNEKRRNNIQGENESANENCQLNLSSFVAK
ncbi:hypothetical protein NE237_022869 [Protea cynaroides]|uniref:Uncharacterized protein n=1 Tax=Protea cynaroides TaxID=273540 RepID=A0A9Q0K5N5_9MAGN|nr:hypothetical protein NE237_022869 [Protea cynaroides]